MTAVRGGPTKSEHPDPPRGRAEGRKAEHSEHPGLHEATPKVAEHAAQAAVHEVWMSMRVSDNHYIHSFHRNSRILHNTPRTTENEPRDGNLLASIS